MKKLLVVLLVLCMAIPAAMAAEVTVGGEGRIVWSYLMKDKDANTGADKGINEDTDMNFLSPAAGTNRINISVKTSDTISAFAEVGYTGNEAAKFRQMFARWNFGSGNLTVGHTTTPAYQVIAHSVLYDDTPMLFDGQFYTGRMDQLKLAIGGLEVALIENKGTALGLDPVTGLNYSETDILIPKIEAAYTFKTDMLWLRPFVGFQTFSSETAGANQQSETTNSFVIGSYAKVNLGPIWVGGDIFYAVNPGNYFVYQFNGPPPAGAGVNYTKAAIVGGDTQDATTYAGVLAIGFKPTDMVALEAGIGYNNLEQDIPNAKIEDDQVTWYFQVPLTLAKGMQIIPEVGQIIRGDLKQGGVVVDKQGTLSYISALFKINF